MEPTCGLWLDGVALSARDCAEAVRLNLILLALAALVFALALAVRWSPLRNYRIRIVRRGADRDGGE
jgi:hypothetical protein